MKARSSTGSAPSATARCVHSSPQGRARGGRHRRRPGPATSSASAPTRCMPVSTFRWTSTGGSASAAAFPRARHPLGACRRWAPAGGATASAMAVERRLRQQQDGGVDAGLAEGHPLLHQGHRQPGAPRRPGRPGPPAPGPVAVAVGLDHRAQRGPGRPARPGGRRCGRTAPRSTSAQAGRNRSATVGRRSGRSGHRRRPGRPELAEHGDHQVGQVAGHQALRPAPARPPGRGRGRPGRPPRRGATPRARKAPITPESTSPVPAVASRDEPAVATRARPSGAGHHRGAAPSPGPPSRRRRPAVGRRPAGRRPGGRPSRRAYSPSWGVSTTVRLRRAAAARGRGGRGPRGRRRPPPSAGRCPVHQAPHLGRRSTGHGPAPDRRPSPGTARRPRGRPPPSPSAGSDDAHRLGGRELPEVRPGHPEPDHAGPGPGGGPGAESGRPGHARRAGHHQHRRAPLVVVAGGGPAPGGRRRRRPTRWARAVPGSRPMSATTTRPASRRPVPLDQAGLAGGEGHRPVGGQHRAGRLAGVAGHPRGDVHRQHRRPGDRRRGPGRRRGSRCRRRRR